MTEITMSIPLWLALVPFLGAVLVFCFGQNDEKLRNGLSIGVAALTVVLTVIQFIVVWQGNVILFGLPWFLGFGLYWRVDLLSAIFAVVVSVVWLAATVFACEYMRHEHAQNRFFTFFIFTLGASLGVFLAGDLFSLFLFFELMTFSAYVLVIHEEDRLALQAGNVYLYMSIVGGLSLLAAVFMIQNLAGTTAFVPLLEKIVEGGINPWIILFAVMLGFGVKAGMLPLHIWLPKAHPIAPAPASALLSALMIKAGAYGFVRFLLTILTPLQNEEMWAYTQDFGYLFLWVGAATMLIGAVMGVLNRSMKRILAYSSISQMGYILFALGVGAFLGNRGAFGLAGAWMHMINHAFFKSFLFLLAGAIYLQTHDLDLNKLGGLRKKMPWAFGFFLVAAAGITGVPLFNGYVSKVLIHEAILEAYHIKHWPSLLWLERIFVITGGLTVAYITKLWMSTFGGKLNPKWDKVKDISLAHKGVFSVFTVIILGIGLFAQRRVDQLVVPVAQMYRFYPGDIHHLHEVPFWHGKELAGPALAYVIGLSVLLVKTRLGDRIKIPRWLSVEYLFYIPLNQGLRRFIRLIGQISATKFPTKFPDVFPQKPFSLGGNPFTMKSVTGTKSAVSDKFQKAASSLHESEKNLEKNFWESFDKTKAEKSANRSHPESMDDAYWSTSNLGFDSLIVALVIALTLLIFLSIGF